MARRKGWILFFVIFGIFAFFGLMLVLAISAFFDDTPVVKNESVLNVTLSGLITEKYPRDAFGREFEGASLQMYDLHRALEMAAVDDRIRGIYLRVLHPGVGWAKAQEIRQMLHKFKKSGKFITAFMETCDEKSYYIALAADEIYLQPHSFAEFNGFVSEVPFVKRAFNKLGMQPQVNNIGKYKSAGDILKRESMSEAHREATEALLNDIYEEFVSAVCERRGLDRTEFEAALNTGISRSGQALEMNLVDGLKYETDVLDLLKAKVHGDEATNGRERSLRTINASRYAQIPADEVGLGKGDRLALIYAIGNIMGGESSHDPLFGRNMGSAAVVRMLRSANSNRSVKAIVMRVDSPGGSPFASDVVWAEIEKVREKKPVIISMSDVAASGGYWIAMGADAIVAQPTTITGSIGVVGTIFDLSGTYDKLGINWETVKKGDHADMITDKRPLRSDEWQIFKDNTYAIYKTFVEKVAEGREMSWDEVHEIAQGRVWTGKMAHEIGLVDSLGGLDAALAIAKEKADIAADAPTRWLVYPQPKSFFESLFDKIGVFAARFVKSSNQDFALLQNLPDETKSLLKQVAVMNRARNGEVIAVAPFIPNIH